uniref:Probable magnesium transporter n=1 Tax=Oryza glumipatula TaxID=40148 RepID=A0A0D9ZSW1_9ORYZ
MEMEARGGGGRWYAGGMSTADNIKGLLLALSSSLFIGASFIIKKKGLKKAASSSSSSALRAVVVGEVANFAAYAFAPAILVTPLGALSIIIRHVFHLRAILAHFMLREKLHIFGILGCILCVVGSTTIVLHAPAELVLAMVAILVCRFVPLYGQTHVMVYIGVCSLVGSISVMSVKALGIALKLTFCGTNQLIYPQTWAFTLALDTFNTAVVSPIYYTMFTSLTILASVIMFKDWDRQNPTQIVTEACGFVTILSGTFLLHKTKDMADGLSTSSSFRLPTSSSFRFSKQTDEECEGIPLRSSESFRSPP